jgi:putative DNA primase/helicase
VLAALIGEENVGAPTLTTLAGEFGLEPLLGKSVAIMPDVRFSGRADVMTVATERLLMISGRDKVTVNRKHAPMVTLRLPTRFVLLSNEIPRLTDASGALAGRFILLRFTKSFLGREDLALSDRIVANELPGILWWAIEGWRRLRAREKFVQPRSGKTLIQDLADLSSPVSQFVREKCVRGSTPEHAIAVADLYAEWVRWCEVKGKAPSMEQVFGRELGPRAKASTRGDSDRKANGCRPTSASGSGNRQTPVRTTTLRRRRDARGGGEFDELSAGIPPAR